MTQPINSHLADAPDKILQTESVKELYAAFIKAQAEFGSVIKDKANSHLKSHYATLASVVEAFRDALNKNGLSVLQPTIYKDGMVFIVTTLIHTSGQWLRSYYPVITQRSDPQGLGSGMTYARRYSLMALMGLAPEDDDGEGATVDTPAQRRAKDREAQQPNVTVPSAMLSKDAQDIISFIRRAKSDDDLEDIRNSTRKIFEGLIKEEQQRIKKVLAQKTRELDAPAPAPRAPTVTARPAHPEEDPPIYDADYVS